MANVYFIIIKQCLPVKSVVYETDLLGWVSTKYVLMASFHSPCLIGQNRLFHIKNRARVSDEPIQKVQSDQVDEKALC